MLGWFRRRKATDNDDLIPQMQREVSLLRRQVTIRKAMHTLRLDMSENPDPTNYCIDAMTRLMAVLIALDKSDPSTMSEDEQIATGSFTWVFGDLLATIFKANFETVVSVAVLNVLGRDGGAQACAQRVLRVAEHYNWLTTQDDVFAHIQDRIATWLDEPTNENLARLGVLFSACRKQALARRQSD